MVNRVIALGAAALLAFGVGGPTLSGETADLSSPERTLDAYVRSLRSGDVAGVKATLDRPEVEFYLPEPISISSYRVMRRIVYGARETNDWNSKGIVPPARVGDVELHVREIIDGKSQMVSYNFRRISGEWRLYSSAVWGAD